MRVASSMVLSLDKGAGRPSARRRGIHCCGPSVRRARPCVYLSGNRLWLSLLSVLCVWLVAVSVVANDALPQEATASSTSVSSSSSSASFFSFSSPEPSSNTAPVNSNTSTVHGVNLSWRAVEGYGWYRVERRALVSGHYGQDGAVYRTELDSGVQVTQHQVLGASTVFEALLPSGGIRRYGDVSVSSGA